MSGRGYERAATAFPVLVDVLHFFLFELLNQPLRAMLGAPSIGATLALLGMYLAFSVSLYFVARLKPELAVKTLTLHTRGDDGRARVTKTTWPQMLFFYPSFGFGILMIMAVVTATGVAASDSAVSEGFQQFAVVAAIVIFFIQLGGMFSDIEPRHAANEPGYLAVLVPTVLVSEIMLNLSVALWHRFLGLDASGPQPSAPSAAGFVVAAPLFLLFFAVPRFTIMSRSFSWPGLVSALALAMWELWHLLAVAPLV